MAYEEIRIQSEASRCFLCHEAPCAGSCPAGYDCAALIRSVRFENIKGAAGRLAGWTACEKCGAACMQNCNRAKLDEPVRILQLMRDIKAMGEVPETSAADLSIDTMGVHCENPFFLSSSVVGSNYEMVAKAFRMGWAGVAFKTVGLFVPEEASPRFGVLESGGSSFTGFKNIEQISDHTLEENLDFLRRLKQDYPQKVIIASIMGQSEEEWTKLAALMEAAGADIIECNFSCPQMAKEGLGSDVGTNPELVFRYTAATRRGTRLPILAKMTPNITRMEEPAKAAVAAGANGVAAINTVKSILNVRLSDFSTAPNVDGKSAVGGYSGKAVKPIALRFIHDMKKDQALESVAVSGMGGIETWHDAAEFLAMGCETLQVTTAVMQYGYRIIDDLKDGLSRYMAGAGIAHVKEMVGAALPHIIDASGLNRDTIEYPRFDKKRCIGCGRCYISCFDGGHQAITMDSGKKPLMDPKKCVGCQLCALVCPAGAIHSGKRVKKDKTDKRQ